ncbi:MAG: hypothetical protein IT443_02355 [Phycisphaeraceae bacterium]|nr:hypothetical protein [Phycisphaeraceae bacterium]
MFDIIKLELRSDYPTAYAPEGYKLKDFSIIRGPDGLFHVYYIKTPQGVPNDYVLGLENMIGHATTPDFFAWQDHDPVLLSLQLSWESRCVIAPYVLRHGEQWWMFYTGTNEHRARLGVATSTDLFRWTRHPINPVYDPSCLPIGTPGGGGCRDPHVARFTGKFAEAYHLYYTIDGQDDTACVGCATSRDLLDWRDAGRVLVSPHRSASGKHFSCAESSAVHEIDGRYLLIVKHCCDQGACHHGSFLIWSDSPTHFDWEKRCCWLDRAISMELVARRGDDFLFACFSCVWWKFHLIKLTRVGERFSVKENLARQEIAELIGS